MKTVAIVGGGVTGLTVAKLLQDHFAVCLYEKEPTPGGLIRCTNVNGSMFHQCGGHVFNTKNECVANWFWSLFNKDSEFIKADRHAAICLDKNTFVDYPIENHVYQLKKEIQVNFFSELAEMMRRPHPPPNNFGEFLKIHFGPTLYDLYFKPFNEKIWRCDLTKIPMQWLEGKFPMSTPQQIIAFNKSHLTERESVHSSFYYPLNNGSQFIADRLAKNLCVRYSTPVTSIKVCKDAICRVNGEEYDEVVFCGNIKDLPHILTGVDIGNFSDDIAKLTYHGTTAVFCETDSIPYSWIYQPTMQHQSHRIICTGNFSPSNNAQGKMTCTVEFTDRIELDEIKRQLKFMPYHPQYLSHYYSQFSYPIQHSGTRETITRAKEHLRRYHIHLSGRFAEWEYFNMDAAISSAMNTAKSLCS